ncbi:MAG: hypothetical protein EBS05_22120 [Proteobacteria bacterium]|nr:hypothetical protein [Pseudomonadota bacterium]NDE97871.1 hypothetical protein [Verrucomicrobiota bacterium]
MGAAYYIVLERELDGVKTDMDGKSLSRHMDALDEAARSLGVKPLSEFFSADPAEAAAFMADEGMEPDDLELPPLQHYTAADGLVTVRALVNHEAGKADDVGQDLSDCERILTAADQHGIRWHFAVDF